MGIIIWLIVGGIVGWLAGMIMRDNNGILLNIVVGIVGAAIAGFLFGGSINEAITISTFIYSLIGAVILLLLLASTLSALVSSVLAVSRRRLLLLLVLPLGPLPITPDEGDGDGDEVQHTV